MKKTIRNLIATTLLATTILAPMSVSAMNINVEGKIKDFDSFVTNGTTVVQLRELTEMLDLKLGYDNATKVVTISNEAKTVVIDTVNSTASVDNHPHQKVTVIVKNGKTYLPFRFVGEQFGFEIGYSNGMPTLGTVDAKSFMFTGKSEIEQAKTSKEKFQILNDDAIYYISLVGELAMNGVTPKIPVTDIDKMLFIHLYKIMHSLEYLAQDNSFEEPYKSAVIEFKNTFEIVIPYTIGFKNIKADYPHLKSDWDVCLFAESLLAPATNYYTLAKKEFKPTDNYRKMYWDFPARTLKPYYATGQYLIDEPWLKATKDYLEATYK